MALPLVDNELTLSDVPEKCFRRYTPEIVDESLSEGTETPEFLLSFMRVSTR